MPGDRLLALAIGGGASVSYTQCVRARPDAGCSRDRDPTRVAQYAAGTHRRRHHDGRRDHGGVPGRAAFLFAARHEPLVLRSRRLRPPAGSEYPPGGVTVGHPWLGEALHACLLARTHARHARHARTTRTHARTHARHARTRPAARLGQRASAGKGARQVPLIRHANVVELPLN